jgi:hypothetical protein
MTRHVAAMVLAGAITLAGETQAHAQGFLDLPRASQRAMVRQRIGITDITINYHRPLVNGRKIWGNVVPYGDVWRAGANENTTIEFSDPVTVEGQPLPKGIYGLHTIPGEKEWTIIFSKNSTSWGSYTYDKSEDALRVVVQPRTCEPHEALTYDFDDPKPTSAVVTLRWDKLAVPFKVEVHAAELAAQQMRNQLRGLLKWSWEGWDEAAGFLLDNKALDEALADSNQSIALEERFENLMTKSRVLEALGKKDDARTTRTRAMALGNALQLHEFGRDLQTKGQQDQAFEVFRTNIKKNPKHWVTHSEQARIECAKRDFDGAVKEMKLALAGAPPDEKGSIEKLVKRLEAKEDINK